MKNIIKILGVKQKNYFIYLFFIALSITLLEVVSIGIIFPIIDFILKDNNSNFYSLFQKLTIIFSLNFENIKKNIILIFILFFVFKSLIVIYLQYLLANLTQKINVSLANKLFDGYLLLDYQHYNQHYSSADVIRNIINETANVYSYIYNFVILSIEISIALIIFLTILLVNFDISLVLIISYTFFGYLFILFFKSKFNRWGNERIKFNKERIKSLQEYFFNIEYLKLNIFDKKFYTDFYKSNLIVNLINRNIKVINFLPRTIIEVIIILSFFILIGYFYSQNINLENFLPLLSLYAAAALKIAPSFSRIINSINNIKLNYPSIKLINRELDIIIKKKDNVKNNIIKFKNNIKFKTVKFKYNLSEKKNLKYNFSLKKNHTYVIYGSSGSGKSTFIKILLGLLKYNTGKILMDNQLIETSNMHYRKLFGYVPQNIYLINDTIKNNILLGRKLSNFKLQEVIKNSSLNTFYKKKGSNFFIGENGNKLSGGEKQRIALARALVTDPEILIFDEFTSSLDVENTKKVLSAIQLLHRKKTIIIISHNPKKIKFADKFIKI